VILQTWPKAKYDSHDIEFPLA